MHRALVAVAIAFIARSATSGGVIVSCEPTPGQTPVCQFRNPEDLAPLPGGRALVVSEYGALGESAPGALALFDLDATARRPLFRGGEAKGPATPGWGDPACPGPPGEAFSPHGIDVARRPDGALALAAVQHGGRESIELFELRGSGVSWRATWRGCWIAPEGAWLNEVVLLSDGTVMASHMTDRAGATDTELAGGGYLLHWTAQSGFTRVEGSDIGLANGFELSPDEATIYLGSSSGDGLRRIDRASGEITGVAEIGALDNATWSPDGSLLVAHLRSTDPSEFGPCYEATRGACDVAFQIVAVDPTTLETRVVFDSAGSAMGAGTVGLRVGDELFIGSFVGDRILRVDLATSAPQ